ncbi:MAG: hypothetical protein JO060_06780, partial [Candidatus Eremiobacteraeota bacterium]|nr:hypothetical protein [Candidatus Eremiobacteraeota bacterium]
LTQTSSGGATFSVTLPGDVREALVQITDFGPGAVPPRAPGVPACSPSSSGCPPVLASNCQGPLGTQFAPVYYTMEVTHSGAYALASNHGPNTNPHGGKSNLKPSPSLCTAAQNKAAGFANLPDAFSVQLIGFDYAGFEMARSLEQANPPQAPPITGPGGQSDITISAPIIQNCVSQSSPPNPDCVSPANRPRPSRTFIHPSLAKPIPRRPG